jgi:hypothetical protein
MRVPRRQKPLVVALFVNAALLAALLVALLTRGGGSGPSLLPAALAQNQQAAIGGGAGVFIVPAQFSETSYGCYIMDVDAQTVCAYQYFGKQLRLVAARHFRWDRRLHQFNSENPTPDDVRKMIEREEQDARVRENNDAAKTEPVPQRNP